MHKSLIPRRLVSAFLPTCLSSSLALLAAALLAMLSTAACAGNAKDSAGLVEPGSVLVEFRADETIALKDVEAGTLDLLYAGIQPGALPAETGNILSADAAYMSYSLLFNPAPDRAPYLCRGSDGKERFNPLGIRALREAINRLIDREALARELGAGHAQAQLLPFAPGVSGSAPWYRAAFALGYSLAGDASAALTAAAALETASALPALAGRLVREGGRWTFDGEPVAVRLLIRADDPSFTVPLGKRVAELLESLGLKPEPLEYERARCVQTLRSTNPEDLSWHMYTERWGSGGAISFRDPTMSQMYSMRYGAFYPAGAGAPKPWQPESPEVDSIIDRLWEGAYAGMSEYERDAAAMTGAALTDSFRVFLVQARQSFVFNAATFPSLPALDAEAGMNPWFWRSALRNGSDGAPLRVGVVTRATGVFATTWNPVYPPALYSIIAWPVIEATMEPGAWELCDPMSGKPAWLTSKPVSSSADAKGVDIPDSALSWNGSARRWEAIGPGKKASARVEFELADLSWHTGEKVSVRDALYWLAFKLDWSRDDGEEDGRYDKDLERFYGNDLERIVAVEALSERRMAVYANWGWGQVPDRLALLCAMDLPPVSWPVVAAMEELLLGRGTHPYALVPDGELPAVDLLEPGCVAELIAVLEVLAERASMPAGLGLQGNAAQKAEIVQRFRAAAEFGSARGQLWIGNGPYTLEQVSFSPPFFRLERFGAYPADNAATLAGLSRPRVVLDRIEALGAGGSSHAGSSALTLRLRAHAEAWPQRSETAMPRGAEAIVRLYWNGGGAEKRVRFDTQGLAKLGFTPDELSGSAGQTILAIAEAFLGDGIPSFGSARISREP